MGALQHLTVVFCPKTTNIFGIFFSFNLRPIFGIVFFTPSIDELIISFRHYSWHMLGIENLRKMYLFSTKLLGSETLVKISHYDVRTYFREAVSRYYDLRKLIPLNWTKRPENSNLLWKKNTRNCKIYQRVAVFISTYWNTRELAGGSRLAREPYLSPILLDMPRSFQIPRKVRTAEIRWKIIRYNVNVLVVQARIFKTIT